MKVVSEINSSTKQGFLQSEHHRLEAGVTPILSGRGIL